MEVAYHYRRNFSRVMEIYRAWWANERIAQFQMEYFIYGNVWIPVYPMKGPRVVDGRLVNRRKIKKWLT